MYDYPFEETISNRTTIKAIVLSDGITSVGKEAFYGFSGLTSIMIPESVESIGSGAFAACDLRDVSVDDNNPVYDSREDCNAVIETNTNKLIVGGYRTVIPDSVTGIESFAFDGCSSLTSIEIPNSVTSIGSYAFRFCDNTERHNNSGKCNKYREVCVL